MVDISLSSPAVGAGGPESTPLPATYTCDGKDTPPPLRWSGVPGGTQELALLALNLEAVKGEAFFIGRSQASIPPSRRSRQANSPKVR